MLKHATACLCSHYRRKMILFLTVLLHFWIGLSVQLTPNQSEIQEYLDEQSKAVDDMLKGYDKRFIPAIDGKPLKVGLEVLISDVLYLDDSKMESEIILYIRQEWRDFRLSRNSSGRIKVREHLLDKIWLPDIRLRNLIDMQRFDGFGGINMNVHTNGRVYFSQLALCKISCTMDLRNFPMDKQTCFLNFSSYAYRKTLLLFSLTGEKIIVEQANLPQFEFVEVKELPVAKEIQVPMVAIALSFKRRLGFYILQIYIPSIFLVVLSWLGILMGSSDVTDRLALEVTMILSIVFLHGGLNTSLPHVSYAKAADWFIIVSFWFIFIALLETMLVYRLKSQEPRSQNRSNRLKAFEKCRSNLFAVFKMKKTEKNGQRRNTQSGDESPTLVSENDSVPLQIESTDIKPRKLAVWVDKICAVAFPTFYTVFNIFYWGYYL